ncbi:hypothetical protein FPQ18DRAFT_339714 [Pyronema domesticum]|uniref:Uncharacterized protein n=1 Tax=Pyronema omphalodes (strain CBS 100304) TaxID=1076935 RepID=U4LC81_PYROM|nr:hypothetical protein FPQ18DRAFT_339714 [Pyronema domesticum]CCX16446.1 Similar to hypothetical protein [Tuber melanosporum Mel28]; acc. no. XP_002842024 [Pyronema omphalodes CBS 100304]
MQFISLQCDSCQHTDNFFPRMSPYCSQCTSNFGPSKAPSAAQMPADPSTPRTMTDEDLIQLFTRNMQFTQAAPPTPIASPTTSKFSVSQHYNHSSHYPYHPPSPPAAEMEMDDASSQLLAEQLASLQMSTQPQQPQQKTSDREYMEYLMSSDLSSPNSVNELEIALAHGIISAEEYQHAITAARRKQEMMNEEMLRNAGASRALGENCSAMDMLSAARREKEEQQQQWCNDYYPGQQEDVDDEEESPCSIYSAGYRLRPFDL